MIVKSLTSMKEYLGCSGLPVEILRVGFFFTCHSVSDSVGLKADLAAFRSMHRF